MVSSSTVDKRNLSGHLAGHLNTFTSLLFIAISQHIADFLLIIASQYIFETDIQDDNSDSPRKAKLHVLFFIFEESRRNYFPIHLINTHNVGGTVQDIK